MPEFAEETRRRGLFSNGDELLANGTSERIWLKPDWAGYEKDTPRVPTFQQQRSSL